MKDEKDGERKEYSTYADGVICIPRDVMKSLTDIDAETLKTLVCVCCVKSCTPDEGAELTGMDARKFEACVRELEAKKLVSSSVVLSPKPTKFNLMQTYDSEVIANAIEKDSKFRDLVQIVSESIGKILTKNDLNSLFYLFDYAGADLELICGICAYCVSKGHSSMLYITKTALGMLDDGIDTYDKLEKLIAQRSMIESDVSKFKTLCGFGERELSQTETKYVKRWFEEMSYSYEMVKLAFEKMVDTIGKVRLPYMGTILEDWYKKGYKHPADLETPEKPKRKGNDSFDADEFYKIASKAGLK